MKIYKTPSASKLVARFDNELKNMLLEDLRSFKANTTHTGNQSTGNRQERAA